MFVCCYWQICILMKLISILTFTCLVKFEVVMKQVFQLVDTFFGTSNAWPRGFMKLHEANLCKLRRRPILRAVPSCKYVLELTLNNCERKRDLRWKSALVYIHARNVATSSATQPLEIYWSKFGHSSRALYALPTTLYSYQSTHSFTPKLLH